MIKFILLCLAFKVLKLVQSYFSGLITFYSPSWILYPTKISTLTLKFSSSFLQNPPLSSNWISKCYLSSFSFILSILPFMFGFFLHEIVLSGVSSFISSTILNTNTVIAHYMNTCLPFLQIYGNMYSTYVRIWHIYKLGGGK